MADILIKGMKMPKSCDRCFYTRFCPAHARRVQRILESDADQVFDVFSEMRLVDCPLVEVEEAEFGDLYKVKKAYVTGKRIWMEVEHGLAD